MGKYGLLGHPLGHSWSPRIHALLGPYDYRLYETAPGDLRSFLEHTDLDGMNVTLPHKKEVMHFCSSLSETARRIGSVNTLLKTPEGWHGENTDYAGFRTMMESMHMNAAGKKTLVFGSGGASLAVIEALRDLGASPIINISRRGPSNYKNLLEQQDARILVNTTSLGMYPDVESFPASPEKFPLCECVLDIVYNPVRTAFLMEAERLGIPCAGGLLMLVSQARRSAELFTGIPIPDEAVYRIASIIAHSMQNIVLIGMPGCGKSTVGKIVADRLHRPFIDVDELIRVRAGRDIPAIFDEEGEAGFRTRESSVLREVGMRTGCVIATGGGCVTVPENYPLLHRSGVIFCLKRNTDRLPTEGRPISQSGSLEELLRKREPLYKRFSDFEIDNNGTISETADTILEVFDL